MTVQSSKRSNGRENAAAGPFQGSGNHSGDPLRPVMGPGDLVGVFRDRADALSDHACDTLHAALDYAEGYLVFYGPDHTAEYLFGLARVEVDPEAQGAIRDLADEFARRFRS